MALTRDRDLCNRRLHTAMKHRRDIELVESALSRDGLSVHDRHDLQAHLAWLRGGPQRTLDHRTFRYVSVFARPLCVLPDCKAVAIYLSPHSSRRYCRKHRMHVSGDMEATIAFRGYRERSDDIAARAVERDSADVGHGTLKNSGSIQAVRGRRIGRR